MHNPSVVVVGAGILGCSLANALARHGCKVTIVDASEPGNGTTATSYAWVNANSKEPYDYFRLNYLGLQAHERWAQTRTLHPWFHQCGNIAVAQDDSTMADLEQKADRLCDRGYDAKLVTRAQLEHLEPEVDFRRAVGGVHYPSEGWVDVTVACPELIRETTALGGVAMAFRRVVEIDPAGLVTVSDPAGATTTLSADIVVLAAGNGIQELADGLGIEFPIVPTAQRDDGSADETHPTVGLTCATSPVNGAPRHMLRFDGIAMRPSRNGGLTLTDHPTASQWDSSDPRLLSIPDLLLSRARTVVPRANDAIITSVAMGHRVLPTDGVTIADWIGAEQRIYAIATHSGVTLAAHLADTVAGEICTGIRDQSLDAFGLGRFDLATALN